MSGHEPLTPRLPRYSVVELDLDVIVVPIRGGGQTEAVLAEDDRLTQLIPRARHTSQLEARASGAPVDRR